MDTDRIKREAAKMGFKPEAVEKALRLLSISGRIEKALDDSELLHDDVLEAIGGLIAEKARGDVLKLITDLTTLNNAAVGIFEIGREQDTAAKKQQSEPQPVDPDTIPADVRADIEKQIRKDLGISDDTEVVWVN